MNRPNLFQIATSELSQDAFFTWLMQWADPSNIQEDPTLCAIGQDFVRLLLGKSRDCDDIMEIDKVVVRRQVATMQDGPRKRKGFMDIWVEVNDRFLLVIEDKTGTAEHSGQLDFYKETAEKHCTGKNMLPSLIYIKTQDETKSRINVVEEKGFRFVSRKDLLLFFKEHPVDNDIYGDFVSNLDRIEASSASFRTRQIGEWSWGSWCGFLSYLDEVRDKNDWGEWKYVANPSGGFLGACWHFLKWRDYMVYLQIEQNIHENKFGTCRLCFKIQHVKEENLKTRNEWAKIILAHAAEYGFKEIRPAKCRKGENMTVAVIDRTDWLGPDGSIVDLEQVVARLHKYEKFINESAKMTDKKYEEA